MKNLFLATITSALVLACCTKPGAALPEDSGCIERVIIPVTAHSIPGSAVISINKLFSSNGIDNSRYRYFQYVHDTFQTRYPPYTQYDEQAIRVDQYVNGLRLFTGDLNFIFWDNRFHSQSGDSSKGTSLDTLPRLTTGQIRKLFLDDIEQFENAADKFKDSCFTAEFGYFNMNAGISNAGERLAKAWKVTTKNYLHPSHYPVAYYQDNDGKLIYYDNGIRTFR